MKKLLAEVLEMLADDQQGRKLVDHVLIAAAYYVRTVVAMESALLTTLAEGEERRELTEHLDRNRTLAHNALIDSLNICVRYLNIQYPGQCSVGGIYPEPSQLLDRNRRAIGDWAGRIVNELFTSRY